mmetsp:Transcript_90709/g.211022  ORF Transcript_90709/g.211022 Transcript_90709/m.211022 type:complete len:224 (+) Transcript_90709:655-1326(+)
MHLVDWEAARAQVLGRAIMLREQLETAHLVLDRVEERVAVLRRGVEHGVRHADQGSGADAGPQLRAACVVQQKRNKLVDRGLAHEDPLLEPAAFALPSVDLWVVRPQWLLVSGLEDGNRAAMAVSDEIGAAQPILDQVRLDAVVQCLVGLLQDVVDVVGLTALRAWQELHLAVGLCSLLDKRPAPVLMTAAAGSLRQAWGQEIVRKQRGVRDPEWQPEWATGR